MELLTQEDIERIVKQYGQPKVLGWSIEDYSDSLIGSLVEHLRLKVKTESNGQQLELQFFIKCMPRFDQWKTNYLKEILFFDKEYVMLSSLFEQFDSKEGLDKWRPKLLFNKTDVLVLEDVSELGYKVPHNETTLSYEEIMATVKALAKFHAQSIIFEERKSKELNRQYSIWEDYQKYLQEPKNSLVWRNVGRNAVIDYLKVFSAYISKHNFSTRLEEIVPRLFDRAMELMKPSSIFRNVVVHRDLWQNNIFLKTLDSGEMHALIIDFQTVLYTNPMLDISSFLFMTSTREFRTRNTHVVLETYYEELSKELTLKGIEIAKILDKSTLRAAYEDSIIFGITQAALIVPNVGLNAKKKEELYSDAETSLRVSTVSRSVEFINAAKEDDNYRTRVTEILEEIVERYVFPEKD